MNRSRGTVAGTFVLPVVAAATTWIAFYAWRGFSEEPGGYLNPLLLLAIVVAGTGVALRWWRVPAPLVVLNEPESSLHVSLLEPLAELVRTASSRTQVVLVSHAGRLVDGFEDAERVELRKTLDGTVVEGQGFMSVPAWNWGKR